MGIIAATLCGGLAGLALAEGAAIVVTHARRLEARRPRASAGGRSLLVAIGRQVARMRLVKRLAPPGDLRSRIVTAGEPANLGVREWISIKAASAVMTGAMALPLASAAPGRLGPMVAICAPAAGFFVPDFWLARATSIRIEGAVRELPDMLDLLRVAVQAGMPPNRALASVASRFDGPLARECRRAVAATVLGTPADEALDELAARLPDQRIAGFAESLRSAHRHGLALGNALETLAKSARHMSHQRMRERAAKAGPKIQLVVAVVLVPSVLLVVAAALVSELAGAGLGVR
ncbi:MAG: type II secretion system F family protein [Solirubrobacterales bacterium]